MRAFLSFLIALLFLHCGETHSPVATDPAPIVLPATDTITYVQLKANIASKRKELAVAFDSTNDINPVLSMARDYWVRCMGSDLFTHWQNTRWDFNGTTTTPGNGTIACGFFVTTLLRDMEVHIDRRKLAICASLQMMRSLVPDRSMVRNLSSLTHEELTTTIRKYGKGVYIIGLDFHTGFIVHDGEEVWFVHSNYIDRKGVTKESVSTSAALRASATKWIAVLTNDDFLQNWLK